MATPVSVRLDRDVRQTLEEEARSRNLGLSAFLREVATAEARRLQRERIRRQSEAVGAYVAASTEATAFYEDWGSALAHDDNIRRRTNRRR